MAAATKAGKVTGTLVCPECGREFTRPASLGAHRRRAHEVAGASRAASSARGSRRRRQPVAASNGRRAATTMASSARQGRDGSARVDRDRLLSVLFPNGIPARSETLGALNAWLEEAERLASTG